MSVEIFNNLGGYRFLEEWKQHNLFSLADWYELYQSDYRYELAFIKKGKTIPTYKVACSIFLLKILNKIDGRFVYYFILSAKDSEYQKIVHMKELADTLKVGQGKLYLYIHMGTRQEPKDITYSLPDNLLIFTSHLIENSNQENNTRVISIEKDKAWNDIMEETSFYDHTKFITDMRKEEEVDRIKYIQTTSQEVIQKFRESPSKVGEFGKFGEVTIEACNFHDTCRIEYANHVTIPAICLYVHPIKMPLSVMGLIVLAEEEPRVDMTEEEYPTLYIHTSTELTHGKNRFTMELSDMGNYTWHSIKLTEEKELYYAIVPLYKS